MGEKYVPPRLKEEAFHCPHCQVYAWQHWQLSFLTANNNPPLIWRCTCLHCKGQSIWIEQGSNNEIEGRMIYPDIPLGPTPHEDMPEEIKADYLEALSIVSKSPRGAAALLRLALQKLLKELGEKGKNINNDIESLVKKGLPEEIQIALDTVRVIGNEAVHPGVLDLKDDQETAMMLFELINYIVEEQIARKKRRAEFMKKLPESIQKKILR